MFERAQKLGILGKSIAFESIVEHSLAFKKHLRQVNSTLDLGSGAGVPGLLLAYGDSNNWVLCERSAKRADFLRWAIEILKFDNVDVLEIAAEKIAKQYDCITARAFLAPAITFEIISNLLEVGGKAVVSSNPTFRDWNLPRVKELGFETETVTEPYSFLMLTKFESTIPTKRSLQAMKNKPLW